jgi:dipeptidyl aminopeptidase/acylaminoacyl peptidase
MLRRRRIGYFVSAMSLASLLWVSGQNLPVSCAAAGQAGNERPGQVDSTQEIQQLREEIRQLKALVKDLRSQDKAVETHLTFAPEVEVQREDYAQARLRFHTKLLRRGPAPQPGELLKPPPGVSEIEYPSGELRLKAWVNRPPDTSRRYPAVLFLHGGFAFDTSDWDETKPYREAGFVVLTPILRAENGQPGAFSYFYLCSCQPVGT